MRTITIKANDANQRLDKFLNKAVPLIPTNLMYKLLRNKRIKLNGKKTTHNVRLNEGDILTFYLSDDFFETEVNLDFMQCKLPLEIVYEDANVLIFYKDVNTSVHEDENNKINNSVNALKKYLSNKGEYHASGELSFAPAIVNRLDRNTSGLVMAAKSAQALRDLNTVVKERLVHKFYLCAVRGVIKPSNAKLVAYTKKDELNKIALISSTLKDGYSEIKTNYQLLKANNNKSLLEVELITGKFHQIRAHLASVGYPLIGDVKYGGKALKGNNQLLSAYKLVFDKELPESLSELAGKSFEVSPTYITDYVKK